MSPERKLKSFKENKIKFKVFTSVEAIFIHNNNLAKYNLKYKKEFQKKKEKIIKNLINITNIDFKIFNDQYSEINTIDEIYNENYSPTFSIDYLIDVLIYNKSNKILDFKIPSKAQIKYLKDKIAEKNIKIKNCNLVLMNENKFTLCYDNQKLDEFTGENNKFKLVFEVKEY